jgi:exodeoxyribonuclease VII small subunit
MTDSSLPPDFDYEATVEQVEAIIADIDSGTLPLEDVFEQFRLGVEQLRNCETFLTQGKEEMEIIVETLEDS